MENHYKILALIIIIVITMFSCKKNDEPPYHYTPHTDYPNYAYYTGIVYDSQTGLPLKGAYIYWDGPYRNVPLTTNNWTDSNGRYFHTVIWGGHYGPPIPYDTVVVTYKDNLYGYTSFSTANIHPNDTISSDIIANPTVMLKLHLKDTSVTELINFNYFFVMSPDYNFYYHKSALLDTLILWKAYPNRNINFSWFYRKDNISHNGSYTIFVGAIDTTFAEIKY